MKIEISSDNRTVVASGTTIAYDVNKDITLTVNNDETQEKVTFILSFETDETGKMVIERAVNGSVVEMRCKNFKDYGTGSSVPLLLWIWNNGSKLLFRFWMQMLGSGSPEGQTRLMHYTFYEERGHENAR